jgi:hypothetical protein
MEHLGMGRACAGAYNSLLSSAEGGSDTKVVYVIYWQFAKTLNLVWRGSGRPAILGKARVILPVLSLSFKIASNMLACFNYAPEPFDMGRSFFLYKHYLFPVPYLSLLARRTG